jgi:hypothetical protein
MAWKLCINGVDTPHETFREAFIELYKYIKDGTPKSQQLLESFVWIIRDGTHDPILIYRAIEKARNEKILSDDGKII